MKKITLFIVFLVCVAAVATFSFVSSATYKPTTDSSFSIVANCRNGQFEVPFKGDIFLEPIKAGFKPEAAVPIPPRCER
jgi:hypothetical protein